MSDSLTEMLQVAQARPAIVVPACTLPEGLLKCRGCQKAIVSLGDCLTTHPVTSDFPTCLPDGYHKMTAEFGGKPGEWVDVS